MTQPTFETLDRYLRGEASQSERARVDAWMGQDPERRTRVLEAMALVQRAQGTDPRRILEVIKRRVAGMESPGWPNQRVKDSHRVRRMFGFRGRPGTAGVLRFGNRPLRRNLILSAAIVLGIGVFWSGIRRTLMLSATRTSAARTYVTRSGQRTVVSLSDGTRVVLGPQTSLVVDPEFGVANRTITLTGEAYFDVTQSAGRPFTVHVGRVTSRVLGTTFAVKHYATDTQVRVAVVSGKIAVGTGRQQLVLTRGAIAQITDSMAIVTSGADLRESTSWASGNLVFTETPVSDILTTLGRWYGLEFRLTDPALAREHVTATLDPRARADMLAMLRVLLNVRMTFSGNTVILTPVSGGASRGRREMDDSFAITHMREVGR